MSDEVKAAIEEIDGELAKFNDLYEKAVAFMGVLPALPSNEMRQVMNHLRTLSGAIADGNIDIILREQARALKHIALMNFDCTATLNLFHVNLLKLIATDAQARTNALFEEFRALVDQVKGLQTDALGALLPSDPKSSISETNEDTLIIRRFVKQQIEIADSLEELYSALSNLIGVDLFTKLFNTHKTKL